jgi:hypothetical protein
VTSWSSNPDDDPASWNVDTTVDYDPIVSPPTWIVPSAGVPSQDPIQPSNNNEWIAFHDNRLFFVWRTGEMHFSNPKARLNVMSSADFGQTWDFETTIAMGCDVREPSFVSIGGRLFLRFFNAGTLPYTFDPQHLWRCERLSQGNWTQPATWGDPGAIIWDTKTRGGKLYQTSYVGTHYGTGPSAIDLRFETSTNGIDWAPVSSSTSPVVYTGGVSEASFEFDENGDLWAVTRDEDGDATGFGSHVVTAPASDLGNWSFPSKCDPQCYESPRLFRHGKDLYLIARRDPVADFDLGLTSLPLELQRWANLAEYGSRPKRTTLFSIDRATKTVVPVVDLPGCGDTAFPSIWRLDAHTFLVANYTSPLNHPDWAWLQGQVSSEGSKIYFVTITFQKH